MRAPSPRGAKRSGAERGEGWGGGPRGQAAQHGWGLERRLLSSCSVVEGVSGRVTCP